MNIRTAYYNHRSERLKCVASLNPNNAMVNCFARLVMNVYGATYAEVYEADTGLVLAQFKAHKNGVVECTYKYDARNYKAPMRIKLDVLMK